MRRFVLVAAAAVFALVPVAVAITIDRSNTFVATTEPTALRSLDTISTPDPFPTPSLAPALTTPPTTGRLTEPAQAQSTAVRLSPPEPPPFDCVGYINSLDYGWHTMTIAMEAFRVTASCEGASKSSIDLFTPFAYDLIVKESGGCPNALGGDLFVEGRCDQYTRHGTGEDSGFGQATTSLYGRAGILCRDLGVCSQAQVIESPYSSMKLSVVYPLMKLGRYPWCDYEGAPHYHNCSLISKDARL